MKDGTRAWREEGGEEETLVRNLERRVEIKGREKERQAVYM